MTYQVCFSKRFRDDIREARKWYNQRKKGLGKKFYSEVEDSLKAIKKSPHFQIRYDNIRCLPLNKYPFMIHFTIDEETEIILVLGCIHCSLEPHSHWINEI